MQYIPLALTCYLLLSEKGNWQSLVSFMAGIRKKTMMKLKQAAAHSFHWTFVTPFHFMLVGFKNYLYCFALYTQQLIGHSFYMLCWNCHMWIFSPWFFSIEYFGKIICIDSISFLRKYTWFFWFGKKKMLMSADKVCGWGCPNAYVSRK